MRFSEASMNHSIYSADRTTHLKIVIVALLAAIVVTGLAVSCRIGSNAETVAVVKADKPVAVTGLVTTLIR
jgi:hypothetical protein